MHCESFGLIILVLHNPRKIQCIWIVFVHVKILEVPVETAEMEWRYRMEVIDLFYIKTHRTEMN